MALELTNIPRIFIFKMNEKGKEIGLPDINPNVSPEEVKRFYHVQYPDLLRATIGGPELLNGKAKYTFTSKTDSHG